MIQTAIRRIAMICLLGASAAQASGLQTPLAKSAGHRVADLLPESFAAMQVMPSIYRNQADAPFEASFEVMPDNDFSRSLTLTISERAGMRRMVARAIERPSRMGADAVDAADLGLPQGADCIGSPSQKSIYCIVGSALVQVGGQADFASLRDTARELPFPVYREVFGEY